MSKTRPIANRRHSLIECRDCIAGIIGEKADNMRKILGGVIKSSPEMTELRKMQQSVLGQILDDYKVLIAAEDQGESS
ncbi:hypothetical protein [Hoeflea poritis]|uniref:Uncharacterized protein n=1 Tax=Hoeflea poritis TaxID=2993659 RepID=A0ABT4VMM3_9HYPH|nr:hypothetical protein [Hoeflea poritis]MDA4845937.1 hypothetical protein [Hoeflea poritis]